MAPGMLPFLAMGFLVGMRHALEADHLAAVFSLASRPGARSALPRAGLFWGLGHAVTLVAVAAVVFATRAAIPASWESAAELLVGLLLVVLGARLLLSLRRERVHLHVHRHDGGPVHLHLHSHRGEGVEHEHSPHDHAHGVPWRPALVGLAHGLAGSAGLVVLASASAPSAGVAMAYVVVFSLGTIAGMTALAAAIAFPLRWSPRPFEAAARLVQFGVGALTLGLGVAIVWVRFGALLTS